MFASWREFYESDLQSVYALWLVPAFFMLYWLLSRPYGRLGVEPRAASFLNVYAPLFAIETVIDPFVTGPLLRELSVEDPQAAFCRYAFVLIGDFRVYLLVLFVLDPQRGARHAIVRAVRWTLVAPIAASAAQLALRSRYGLLPPETMGLLHETGFFLLMLFFLARIVPRATDLRRFEVRQYVGALVRFVALYQALWAGADLLIVRFGVDWGWALRSVPNQLYYAFWVPYAYLSFFSPQYAVANVPARGVRAR
jgi:hypothetical protein